MLAKRIIACLDVKNEKVVKGINFDNHVIVGDIIQLAKKYSDQGIDELFFYDITASPENRTVDYSWISKIAKEINIPFGVAGGIDSLEKAKIILNNGADKISINTPAINNPSLINKIANAFGIQCVVVSIDSKYFNDDYYAYKYTGDPEKSK